MGLLGPLSAQRTAVLPVELEPAAFLEQLLSTPYQALDPTLVTEVVESGTRGREGCTTTTTYHRPIPNHRIYVHQAQYTLTSYAVGGSEATVALGAGRAGDKVIRYEVSRDPLEEGVRLVTTMTEPNNCCGVEVGQPPSSVVAACCMIPVVCFPCICLCMRNGYRVHSEEQCQAHSDQVCRWARGGMQSIVPAQQQMAPALEPGRSHPQSAGAGAPVVGSGRGGV